MVFLSSTGSFQKRPFEQPHVEEPAFGIALADKLGIRHRRGADLALLVTALKASWPMLW